MGVLYRKEAHTVRYPDGTVWTTEREGFEMPSTTFPSAFHDVPASQLGVQTTKEDVTSLATEQPEGTAQSP